MNQIASASALLLAAILGWAGVAKVRDHVAAKRSFSGLGVRVPVGAVVAAEVAIALTLVVFPRVGGIAAAVLLAAFTGVLLRALSRHSEVTCGCFGSGSDDSVGPATIVRNVLLLCAAVAATFDVRPAYSLAAFVLVSTAATSGLVVVTLVGLRTEIGALLRTSVASPGPVPPASVQPGSVL